MYNSIEEIRVRLADIDAEVSRLDALDTKADKETSDARAANAKVSELEAQRKGILAMAWTGEKVPDTRKIDEEIKQARATAAKYAQSAEAAEAARGILAEQLAALDKEAEELKKEVPGLAGEMLKLRHEAAKRQLERALQEMGKSYSACAAILARLRGLGKVSFHPESILGAIHVQLGNDRISVSVSEGTAAFLRILESEHEDIAPKKSRFFASR